MLVGAGGNAGNQASVRIIRALAMNEVNPDNDAFVSVKEEVGMAIFLGLALGATAFCRTIVFGTSLPESITIAIACMLIVCISVVTGASLPLILEKMRLGGQNASTSIQVIMDILGVVITCVISNALLEETSFLSSYLSIL